MTLLEFSLFALLNVCALTAPTKNHDAGQGANVKYGSRETSHAHHLVGGNTNTSASVDELLCNKQVFSLEKVDFDTACPECDSFNDDVSGY